MAEHLSRGDLTRILAGAGKEKHLRHIETCQECKNRLEEARLLLQPVPGLTGMGPSPFVRTRVLTSYRKIEAEESPRRIRFLSPALSAAIVLLVAIGATILVYRGTGEKVEYLNATATVRTMQAEGAVTPMKLRMGDSISTGKNEHLTLNVPGNMSVELGPETIINIDRLDRTAGEERLSLGLKRGYLHGDFVHRENRLYAINTPHGTVDSIGTEFYLSVSSGMTDVLLTEGTLRVTAANGESMMLAEGNTCRMTVKSLHAIPSDKNEIDRLRGIIQGPVEEKRPAGGLQAETQATGKPAGIRDESTAEKPASRELRENSEREMRDIREDMRREQRNETGREIKDIQKELRGNRGRRGLLP